MTDIRLISGAFVTIDIDIHAWSTLDALVQM